MKDWLVKGFGHVQVFIEEGKESLLQFSEVFLSPMFIYVTTRQSFFHQTPKFTKGLCTLEAVWSYKDLTPWWRCVVGVDVHHGSTVITSELRNRFVLRSGSKRQHVFFCVTSHTPSNKCSWICLFGSYCYFPSFSCKKPSQLWNKGTTDGASLSKEMEEAWEVRRIRGYGFTGLRSSFGLLAPCMQCTK